MNWKKDKDMESFPLSGSTWPVSIDRSWEVEKGPAFGWGLKCWSKCWRWDLNFWTETIFGGLLAKGFLTHNSHQKSYGIAPGQGQLSSHWLFIDSILTKVGLLLPTISPVLGVLHTDLTELATVGLFIDTYQLSKCFCFLNKLRLYRHILDRKWEINRRLKGKWQLEAWRDKEGTGCLESNWRRVISRKSWPLQDCVPIAPLISS